MRADGKQRSAYAQIGESLLKALAGDPQRGRTSLLAIAVLCGCLAVTTGCESSSYAPKQVSEEVQPQDITDFQTLYQQNCVGCHGVDGKNGASEMLNYPLYLAIVPKEEIHKVITYGRAGMMPPFAVSEGGKLTAKQVNILVNGIKDNWGKPVDFHGLTPPPYYQPADAKIDLADGKKIFTTVCGICHGEHGVVGPLAIPSYLSLASDQYIRTSVIVGKPEKGMPNWEILKRGHPLSDAEITDVVGYLSSLRPPEAKLAMQQSAAPRQPSPEESAHTGNTPTKAGNAGAQTGASSAHTEPGAKKE